MESLTFNFPNEQCNSLIELLKTKTNIDSLRICNEQGELIAVFSLASLDKNTDNKIPISEKSTIVHPSHYNQGKYEVKDVIRDWNLNFNLGNAIKYIARAPYKHPDRIIEDYKKAKQYIDFEIDYLMEEKGYGE